MFLNTIFFLLTAACMIAPQRSEGQQIAGEYTLSGNHEMVAAFKFNADSSFQFYFVYGAVDRMATGTYTINDGKIFLHGNKVPGKDFTLKEQAKKGTGTTIKILDNNPALLPNVWCLFKKGNQEDVAYSDNEGIAHSLLNDCDSISVMHTLYPDVFTVIKPAQNGKNNFFTLSLNPSLAEVSFSGFVLTIGKDTLSGRLPSLFENNTAIFIRR